MNSTKKTVTYQFMQEK